MLRISSFRTVRVTSSPDRMIISSVNVPASRQFSFGMIHAVPTLHPELENAPHFLVPGGQGDFVT